MPIPTDSTSRASLSARTAAAWRVVPIPDSGGKLCFGALAPSEELRSNLSVLLDAPVTVSELTENEMESAFHSAYGLGADALAEAPPEEPAAGDIRPDDSAMARFVTRLIDRAHADGATDIHIEPDEQGTGVRFRIDGLLTPAPVPDNLGAHAATLVSRIKVIAGMDIAERRLPQDGHLRARSGEDDLDIRVSTVPTVHGETVDLRLLPRNRRALSLEDIGLDSDILARLIDLIARPNGLLLVTGPTGHGKTTTLYACLRRLNDPARKIITIEDPVEYRLRGVSQIQVHPKIGLTFASGLRAVLRQDPDVLMVGEIRDVDTAEIAIRSSLTGHLVFSSLHTNDAVSAVARLVDMGIEPYLVAASVNAVLGQRLVRRICPDCRGTGCEPCRGTGLRGRTGLFELLLLNDELRQLIADKTPVRELRRRAVSLGLRTLYDDGRRKSEAGLTTIVEVRRVAEDV